MIFDTTEPSILHIIHSIFLESLVCAYEVVNCQLEVQKCMLLTIAHIVSVATMIACFGQVERTTNTITIGRISGRIQA